MTARYTCEGGVARIVLDAPQRRNALDRTTLAEIVRCIRLAEQNASCVVIAAEGPVFSAGADFTDLTGTAADIEFDTSMARTAETLRRTHLPVVAAVQGPCLGAAVDLVASADIVVATTVARFEVPAIRLGILYSPVALSILRSRLTGALVRALMLGVPVTAGDAMAGGLVARVVEPDTLDAAVGEITDRLLLAFRSATGATKELLNSLDDGSFTDSQWQQLRLRLLGSPERFDAIAARTRSVAS